MKSDVDKSDWGTYDQLIKIVKLADIIEVDRGDYKHFALYWKEYNGKHVCIHIYKDDDGSGKKQLQYLDEIVGDDLCRINNLTKEAKARGLSELPLDKQIAEAIKGVSKQDLTDWPYDVVTNNCEKQVTQWKYGCGFSKQVSKVLQRFIKGKVNISASSRQSSGSSRIGGANAVMRQ